MLVVDRRGLSRRGLSAARFSAQSAGVAAGAWLFAGLGALRAAGLNGTAPPHASSFKALITTLTDNWVWLIATGVGLMLVLIAGLLVFGSQRAPDYLFRVIGGVMLIMIVIPAILA